MLYVTCKGCEADFATGISVGFAGRPVLGDHNYECPKCGHEATYRGEDYHQKEPSPEP